MDTNKRMFRFVNYDLIKGSAIFWLVMLIVNMSSMLIPYIIGANTIVGPMIKDGFTMSFTGSNFVAVFIFFIVYGLEMYYENFSLAVGFGGTRRNFYINAILSNIIIAILFSSIQIILLKIDNYIVSLLGYKPIVDFGLFNLRDSIFSSVIILAFMFLVLVSITNLLGVMQYRFGYKFWVVLGIFILTNQLITNFIGRFFGSIVDIDQFIDFIKDEIPVFSNYGIFSIGFSIIIAAYSIGFIFVRRANIK